MGNDDGAVFTSDENAHRILEWQTYTYHHIQSLATGILGAVFSGLAIAITLTTAFRKSIPSIPWAGFSSHDTFSIYGGYALPRSFAQAEVALNWIMASFGLVLAGFILAEGVYYFGVIVLGDRLAHLANTEDVKLVPVPQNVINSLQIPDFIAKSRSEWIVANTNLTQRADDLLRHGLYRLPIAVFLAVYFVYIYLLSVQVSLTAILLNQINTIFISALVATVFWKKDLDSKITRPTYWLWVAQILFAFIGLGIFIVGI